MLRYLVLFLITVPFIDIYILIQLSSKIGFLQTLAIVVATGLIGAELIRREGRHVLRKLQRSVTGGEVSRNMAEGVMIVFSGLLLLTPGLVTDVAGFLLVFRPVRERLVARWMNSSSVEVEVISF